MRQHMILSAGVLVCVILGFSVWAGMMLGTPPVPPPVFTLPLQTGCTTCTAPFGYGGTGTSFPFSVAHP
jgi:hypothetical protein